MASARRFDCLHAPPRGRGRPARRRAFSKGPATAGSSGPCCSSATLTARSASGRASAYLPALRSSSTCSFSAARSSPGCARVPTIVTLIRTAITRIGTKPPPQEPEHHSPREEPTNDEPIPAAICVNGVTTASRRPSRLRIPRARTQRVAPIPVDWLGSFASPASYPLAAMLEKPDVRSTAARAYAGACCSVSQPRRQTME